MNRSLTARIMDLLQRRRLKGTLAKIALALSCVAIFLITYMLVAPVLTQEWETTCGMEEHTHTDACYAVVPAEGAGHKHTDACYALVPAEETGHRHTDACYALVPADGSGHKHTDACYKEVRGELSCETAEHVHSDECWDEENNQICGLEEHTHGESCYEHNKELVCGLEETDGQEQEKVLICGMEETEEQEPERVLICGLEETEEQEPEKVLICGMEEHTHTDQCYYRAGNSGPEYICGFRTEHTHGEDCYFESGELKCTIPEHVHDDSCLPAQRPEGTDRLDGAIFPEARPEGYVEVDVFSFSGAMFSAGETGAAGPDALVYAPADAFEEDVMFVPYPLADGDDAYAAAVEALAQARVKYDSMAALDLSFINENQETLEPNTGNGPVYVRLTMPLELPEKAELALWHHTGDGIEKVEADIQYENGTLTVDFAADGFSTYAVTVNEPQAEETGLVQWGNTALVEPTNDGDVWTWDVSGTAYRYLKIPVRINASGSDSMTITLPYVLKGVGRTVDGKQYQPTCDVGGIDNNGWSKDVNEEANTVTLKTEVTAGHESLDVYYVFDCWNVPSDAEFTMPCTVAKRGGQPVSYELKGRIHTGHDVEIAEYQNGYGNSDYAFDGFGGADKQSAYIQKWNPVYETYFGLKEGEFDGENYVYDIAAFLVSPKGQQPYDINVSFAADQGGVPVGAVYMMDSRSRPDALCVKVNEFQVGEGGYGFTIDNESLMLQEDSGRRYAVVSGNLSDATDNKTYTLYFLVKYPKADIVVGEDKNIKLNASLSLTHTGVDSQAVKSAAADTCLYKGQKEPPDRIYWGSYVSDWVESRAGLTSLRKGSTATADFSADFFCLNENRENFQRNVPEENLDKYRLEAIIDLSYLTNGGIQQLKAGDYRLSAYRLSLIDAAGNWSQNTHGTPNVGWTEAKFNAPGWAADEKIEIYGSTELEGNNPGNWVKLGEVPAADVWAIDQDRAFKVPYTSIDGNYVRLKVVYNSRLTTVLRVGYQMELQPDGPSKLKDLQSETLNLTNWFNYVAYTSSGAADLGFSKYPVDDSNPPWANYDGTISWARQYDADYPCKGYEGLGIYDQKYSLRNFARAELGSSVDSAGMVVGQVLYDSEGNVVGVRDNPADLNPAESYSRKQDVVNASEIVYTISGIITDGSISLSDLQEHQKKAPDGSPYHSMKQRYYVLLPAGLQLNTNPAAEHYSSAGETGSYLSANSTFYKWDNTPGSPKVVDNGQVDVPVSAVSVPGLNRDRHDNSGYVSEMYWESDGDAVHVETRPVEGNRQLVIFERTIQDSSSNARFDIWDWGGKPTYFWGRGLSFSVVPVKGTGSLAAKNYQTEFWCQYLDENGNPVSMSDFAKQDAHAGTLSEAARELFDADTLLYIPYDFNNSSASNGSDGAIEVAGDDVTQENDKLWVKPEGEYRYRLDYSVTQGVATKVALWCNVEGNIRSGIASDWKGAITGVDLNGHSAKVYVNTEDFDINAYGKAAEAAWLTDGQHGWTEVNPDTYEGWAGVKSVAFLFEDQTFESVRGDSLSVFIKMKAPAEDGVTKAPDKTEYTVYNEFVFSDEHILQGNKTEKGRDVKGPTELNIRVQPLGYQLPSTGGAGTATIYAAGMALILAAACLIYQTQRRGRKSGEGGAA